jgi:hypothetical protein
MRQYQITYQNMIDEHKELFRSFFKIHDAYTLNALVNQNEFNRIGREVQDVVRDYERKLCGKTESGEYSKFSGGLSEKFWGLVRSDFPKIDFVGAIISTV